MTLEIWTWELVVTGGTTEGLWALIGVGKDLCVFGYVAETDPILALLSSHFTRQTLGCPASLNRQRRLLTYRPPLSLNSHSSPATFSSSLLDMCTTFMTATVWLGIYPGLHEKLWSGFGLQWYTRVHSQGNGEFLPANLWLLKKTRLGTFCAWGRLTVILNLDE